MSPPEFPKVSASSVDKLYCDASLHQGQPRSEKLNLRVPVDPVSQLPSLSIRERLFPAFPFKVSQTVSRPAVYSSLPLIAFDLNNNRQNCIASQLRGFLNEMKFDEANEKAHSNFYGVAPISDQVDVAFTHASVDQVRKHFDHKLQQSGLGEKQKLAVQFFMYGEALSSEKLEFLFKDNADLFNHLREFNFVVPEIKNGEISYRLNNLSLVSHQLPNHEVIYLFMDLPEKLGGKTDPTAQISGETSYVLLHRLQKSYRDKTPVSGLVADFGSGTGIQSIALLKLHPQITKSFSVEIDEHSMNLNRLNAMVNGVSDRVVLVNNADPKNFKSALGAAKLDLVVSNPPYNTVPHEYKKRFSGFGYGGDYGLDITKIFLAQALPALKPGGEFIFYSILPKDEKGDYFLTKLLIDNGGRGAPYLAMVSQKYFDARGLEIHYENLGMTNFEWSRAVYSNILENYIQHHYPSKTPEPHLEEDLDKSLKRNGIAHLSPRMVRLVKRPDQGEPKVIEEEKINIPILKFNYGTYSATDATRDRSGGVYIREESLIGKLNQKLEDLRGGSEGRADKGGVYLQVHQDLQGGVFETMHSSPQGGGVIITKEKVNSWKKNHNLAEQPMRVKK